MNSHCREESTQISALGLQVKDMLGQGSFAQVYRCYDYLKNKEYAVKMIEKWTMTSSRLRAFAKEAEILEAIDHKNIVKFHSFHQTDQYLIIKMELIRGGTLKSLLEKRKMSRRPFKEDEIAVFLKNLLEGIRYLHNLNIIHRDLKPENVLFQDDNDLSTVKIVDFGLSAKLQIHNPKNVKAQCGTLLFMAPQIFNKPSYSKSVDIWSCAVIMFMMFNQGRHPFYSPGMKSEDFKNKLKNEEFPKLGDALAQNFLEKVSKKEYEERYNVNQALKHPWITRNKDDEIPLSIYQSYKGFDAAKEIITTLKVFLTLGSIMPHKRLAIDESYRYKINDFANHNEAKRVFSPSRRKVRDKNNQLFIKMKQMFYVPNQTRPIQSNFESSVEESSPTLKKHQFFFSNLFQREKSFEGFRLANVQTYKQPKVKSFKDVNYDSKEQILIRYLTTRQIHSASQQVRKIDSYGISEPAISEETKAKVQNQIQESINNLKLFSRSENHQRRIFKKSDSIETELFTEKKPKMMKKFSHNIQLQKLEEFAKPPSYMFTNRPFSRKVSSPTKNQNSKYMVFSINSKGSSQTKRRQYL